MELFKATDRISQADSLLQEMQSRTDLTTSETNELDRIEDQRELFASWDTSGVDLFALDSLQLLEIESYANIMDRPGRKAISILVANGAMDPDLRVIMPDLNKSINNNVAPKTIEPVNGILRIYPNPAKKFTTVDYRIDRAFRQAEIRIIDMLGQVLFSESVTQRQDQVTIPLRLLNGTYSLELMVEGQHYRSEILVVQ